MTSADRGDSFSLPESVNATKLAPAFIVIGGNTLSRGLTIEGLVMTFLRNNKSGRYTSNVDGTVVWL